MKFSVSIVMAVCVFLSGAMPSVADKDVNRLTVNSEITITPLLELYTSESCSSCPPADRLLSELGDVMDESFHAVPLAFHVDYWNGLGWEDPYSKKQFTQRQKRVAQYNDQRSIYTPEILVGGKEVRSGELIYDWITRRNNEPATVSIMLDVVAFSDTTLQADLDLKSDPGNTDARIFLAIYENEIVRKITAGENRGKTLMHDYVVRYWSELALLEPGESMTSVDLVIDDDWVQENLGIAVVAVNFKTGETLQAVHAPLKKLYL